MINRRIKRLALFSIFLYVFLINTKYTSADIFAERMVRNNNFTTISLDFFTKASHNNNQLTNLFHTLGIQPGGFDLGAVRINANAGDGFKYRAKTVVVNGDSSFCEALKVEVYDRKFNEKFSGRLVDLSLDSQVEKGEMKDFIFLVSLDNNQESIKNKICEFNFDFKTYRDNPDEQGGIFAQRKVENIISSGNW